MIIIVTGDRRWTDTARIREELEREARGMQPWNVTLFHGDCRGADSIAEAIAKELKWNVIGVPYKSELGKAGGPVRNQEIVDRALKMYDREGQLLRSLAFHDNLPASKGTKDMVCRLLHYHIPLRLVNSSK